MSGRFILLAVLLAVHLVFFISTRIQSPVPLSDSTEYLAASENIMAEGMLYCGDMDATTLQPEKLTRRPPLYPLFLSIGRVTGSNELIYLIQILISLIAILLIWRIFISEASNSVGKDRKLDPEALLFLVMLLFTPAQYIYSSRIMAEIPFQLCLVLSAWSIFRYFRYEEEKQIWLFNLYMTLGMAIKPVLFPFAILSILITLILLVRKRRWILLLAVFLPVLWIAGYSIRNYVKTGIAQYSSIQTANLVNYNLRYYMMSREGSEGAAEKVDQIYDTCNSTSSYREKTRCLHSEVKEILLDQPVRYAAFHLKGSVRYFLDPGRFDLASFFHLKGSTTTGFLQELNQNGFRGAFRFLGNQGWGVVLLLVMIGLFKLAKISGFLIYVIRPGGDREFRIYLLLLIGYLAIATGPLGASRFYLPVELLVIGGAIRGWMPLLRTRHRAIPVPDQRFRIL